jgi:hypothetical protein
MIWDPSKWDEAYRAQWGPLYFNFEELEKKAKRSFSPDQRDAIVSAAREFIGHVYENPDPETALGAKDKRRLCASICSAFRRSAKRRNLEPMRQVLELAQRRGLEFKYGLVYRNLKRIREGRVSKELLKELVIAADRLSQVQFPHTRRHYLGFMHAAAYLYSIYREAGGTRRYGDRGLRVRLRRQGDNYVYEVRERFIGDALDFIEAVFDQLAWNIVDDYREAFRNNLPPKQTFRQTIVRAIDRYAPSHEVEEQAQGPI